MSDIVAITNCYCPSTGANVAQIVLFADGTHGFRGDESIARARLIQLKEIPGIRGRIPREIADHLRVHPREHEESAPRAA